MKEKIDSIEQNKMEKLIDLIYSLNIFFFIKICATFLTSKNKMGKKQKMFKYFQLLFSHTQFVIN